MLQVVLLIISKTLGHPIDDITIQESQDNVKQQRNNNLNPDHTGSIFGGLEPDQEDYADYNYDDSIGFLDSPLPAGPTRRPSQAGFLPLSNVATGISVLSQLANFPLLTTKKPTNVGGTTRQPGTHFGQVQSSSGQIGSLLVHSSMDIVDQTKLFSQMDPFQEQFIILPKVNAGNTNLVFTLPIKVRYFYFQELCLCQCILDSLCFHLLIKMKTMIMSIDYNI